VTKIQKQVKWISTPLNLIATYLPSVWGVITSAVFATALAIWTVGLNFIEKPGVQAAGFTFLVLLWTIIALVTIYDRRRPVETFLRKDFRYGLAFEGLFIAGFNPKYEEAALQIGVKLRNYSPSALRYQVESFAVKIDSRFQNIESPSSNFMPRGAERSYLNNSFKLSHIEEFLGKRPEGLVSFSIAYGDVEAPMTRRLKMSFQATFDFPSKAIIDQTPNNIPIPMGFYSLILTESDAPY